MQEIDEQFYKFPKMLMMADAYVSRETGEIVRLTDAEKNVYVVMKARNEFFQNHYDKQSDIAAMCNLTVRKAGGAIRDFTRHGIIESSKVYSGGEHKNLKYSKVHCLELLRAVGEGKNRKYEPLGVLPESLWCKVEKKPHHQKTLYNNQQSAIHIDYSPSPTWMDEDDPF